MSTHAHDTNKKALLYLALGALGVVYGDIGTSPLYAFRESFHKEHGILVTADNVLGILSLIFWALITLISIKYLIFVMRADNKGEGGILALTALVNRIRPVTERTPRYSLILLGLFGTALLYGDGIITPAISVLSAVEGLEVATPTFQPYVLPLTIGILVGLFLFQSQGTERVGKVFGPATLGWFFILALLGIKWIAHQPQVLVAMNPWYGVRFFIQNGWVGFWVLGSVFLVVTGGEALYADMGHFGKKPIRLAWFAVVLPSLLLNYFGQGALLLEQPHAVENPFFHMVPEWALYPVVFVATVATVIASQALITGAFSLTRQAVQLGYLPRMEIRHTSSDEIGQIYIPAINWILMVACVALVLAFRSSTNLAAAYGVAVTTTMVVTALLLFVIEKERWGWPMPVALAFTSFFLVIDLSFWGANIVKLHDGGWLPLAIGVVVFTIMTTWKQGRNILSKQLRTGTLPFTTFAQHLDADKIVHVPGTAVFLYSDPALTPPALLHNVKHNKVLHSRVVLLSIVTMEIPRVPSDERLSVEKLHNGFSRVVLRYGFMENPNVHHELIQQLGIKSAEVTYFLGREKLIPTATPDMAIWRENLFALLARNAGDAADYFGIPADKTIEVGTRIQLGSQTTEYNPEILGVPA